ncbi:hypothetical protein DUI87_06896 [Hirundo rustica rustica]|uniref:Uncharacterized protein n=1 Tax=Hirundo rustica rustica TaxID=333673 RepID=A0A3M0KNU0_HIRRU|nr:hypothetical protein DUI87_06896 [Hirundo rustica rustica]
MSGLDCGRELSDTECELRAAPLGSTEYENMKAKTEGITTRSSLPVAGHTQSSKNTTTAWALHYRRDLDIQDRVQPRASRNGRDWGGLEHLCCGERMRSWVRWPWESVEFPFLAIFPSGLEVALGKGL